MINATGETLNNTGDYTIQGTLTNDGFFTNNGGLVTVDVGGVQKEVVAGIANHYTPESLKDKLVVVVDNMDPAVLRGVTSNGMILAAQDGEKLTLVSPEQPVSPGAIVK